MSSHAAIAAIRLELEQARKEQEIADQRVWIIEERLRNERRRLFRSEPPPEDDGWPDIEIDQERGLWLNNEHATVSPAYRDKPAEPAIPLQIFEEQTTPRPSREGTRVGMGPQRPPAPPQREGTP